MDHSQTFGCFFGNLTRLIGEARLAPRQLSEAIGREPEFVSNLIKRRTSPDADTLHAIVEVLKVEATELLRPEPSSHAPIRGSRSDWAKKLAERALAGALADEPRDVVDVPTLDDVLQWWHMTGGLLTRLGTLVDHVQIYGSPDLARMRPEPIRMGAHSMMARELGLASVAELAGILARSSPEVLRHVATAHARVIDGEPNMSLHSILIDMTAGHVVKLGYARLLLPVHDGEGGCFVLNYSRPFRREKIAGENVDGALPANGDRRPVFAGFV